MPFKDEETSQPQRPPYESGLRLKTLSGHDKIFESFSKDPGGIGFSEKPNGLMLCTEYLGFESYDMRMSDNEVENKMTCHAEEDTQRIETKRRKTKENVVAPARERKREFPPPLSSFNSRGQRSFYLRPVRKDGRLELTQVMIDRPEIFHASREDGRLRLHLIDGVDNPIRAYCDSEEIVDFEEEPKCLDRSHLEFGREINEKNDATSDQVVDSSTINDDNGARNRRYKSSHEDSLNSDDHGVPHFNDEHEHFNDEHDAREWRYKSCYKIMGSRNHEENDYHHHHHNIHPYHHYNRNSNMHLWSRTYVTTR